MPNKNNFARLTKNNFMQVLTNLNSNISNLKKKLTADDISYVELKVGSAQATLIFVKDLIDKNSVGELIIKPLLQIKKKPTKELITTTLLSPEKETVTSLSDFISHVVKGDSCLLIDGINVGFCFGLKKFEKRTITEPPTSTVIKGPREGFVENLPVNISLLRRRIKSEHLIIEELTVGKFSQTSISLCYIKNIADIALVKKVRKKLQELKIDAILDSSYIAKALGEHKTSLFKQVGTTEKPDILTSKILEGRIAIFVDGSPIALTLPYLLLEDFQSPSDYYNSPYSATMSRIIRLFSVLLSIFLPAFYVSAQLFHLQLIPLSFLLTIVNSIKGLPLSPSFEMFFTLMIFEVLNEASVRMPKYVGMVVSIVGGLVLGETAVNAGIISAPALMIIALSGICLYTVPELEKTFSLIRFVLLLIGGSIGIYGLVLSILVMIIYLVSFENYNTPLMAPFSPLVKHDLKDSIYKGLLTEQSIRPFSLRSKNKRRINFN